MGLATEDRGRQLFSAVERIVEGPQAILNRVDAYELQAEEELPEATDDEVVRVTADRLITHYANATAIAGGIAAAPGILPGFGTLIALLPGSLADMTFCLKYEVELALSLSGLYGFNIYSDQERSLAFLIASVSTYELLDSERGAFKDTARVFTDFAQLETQAVYNYTPRQVGKLLTKVFLELAIKAASKSFFMALPIVGVGVSALGNRFLTQQLGARVREALRYRLASEV